MHRAKLLQFKQLSDAFSQVVASKYGFTQEETANVAYLFGHIKEATNRLEDVAVRNLVFNLENRLVVELKNSPSRGSYTVLTIHRDDDYEIITTIVRQPPLTVPDAEW
jgi:hypothetical protein